MPQVSKTLIMKFGGASTKTPECFDRIAKIILRKSIHFPKIAVVVSAMGDMTDQLISLAYKIHPCPPKREYDMLVSVGERISVALLAMSLSKLGREAVSFTGSQSGIITTSHHCEARIIDVKPYRLLPHLEAKKIVIVAGFQGVSLEKEITTLGRGGSDTTAVALGIALRAEKVEFYKYAPGICSEDPNIYKNVSLFSHLTYEEAIEIVCRTGGRVLHPRAIILAQKNAIPLQVRSFHEEKSEGTLISSNDIGTMEPVYEDSLPDYTHRF